MKNSTRAILGVVLALLAGVLGTISNEYQSALGFAGAGLMLAGALSLAITVKG